MTEKLTFENLPEAVSYLGKKLESIENLLIRQTEQQSNKHPDQLLTVQQAAEFLSLAVPTVYSMVSRGELCHMKRSKRLYFSRLELIEYLKAGRKKSNAEIQADAEMYLMNTKKGLINGK